MWTVLNYSKNLLGYTTKLLKLLKLIIELSVSISHETAGYFCVYTEQRNLLFKPQQTAYHTTISHSFKPLTGKVNDFDYVVTVPPSEWWDSKSIVSSLSHVKYISVQQPLSPLPPCLQERLLLSLLPAHIARVMKAEIIQRLQGPNFGRTESTNNFHNLYVQRHTNVR